MNAIFLFFCLFSLILCLFQNPESALNAMLTGANKSILLIFSFASIYFVWMGVYNLLEKSKVTNKIAFVMIKPVNRLLKNKDEETSKLLCMNFACNLLGLGGIATPLGITACKKMQDNNNFFGAELLVVISATSIQILPTSVISLAISYGSANAYSLIMPCLLCTIFSTLVGVLLFCIFKTFKLKIKK